MTRVTKIEIRPSTLELQEGEYGLVEAYLEPASATYADIVWTTDNSNIATVNSGHIVAKKRGTTKVKAVSVCDVAVKGECTLTVIPPKHVQGISFPKAEYTIVLGRPDYIFPNFTPSDALNKDLTWCCYDENIISVTDGLVTPKAAGTTKLIAVSSDGSHTATCTVKVVIDDVRVSYEEGTSVVTFMSTGKKWKCINEDMVFNDTNRNKEYLRNRAMYNFYVNPIPNQMGLIDSAYRTYSDDEIKLLFAIDPHGVAYYIERYAYETNKYNLNNRIAEKDRVFKFLFNRAPLYFRRENIQKWVQTTNTSNINEVLSESETIFGMHHIHDDITEDQWEELGVKLAFLAAELIFTAITAHVIPPAYQLQAAIIYETVESVIKTYVLLRTGIDTVDLIDSLGDALGGYTFSGTDLEWLNELVSAYGDLLSILDTQINSSPSYVKQIANHYAYETNYNINIQLANGSTHNMREICNYLV